MPTRADWTGEQAAAHLVRWLFICCRCGRHQRGSHASWKRRRRHWKQLNHNQMVFEGTSRHRVCVKGRFTCPEQQHPTRFLSTSPYNVTQIHMTVWASCMLLQLFPSPSVLLSTSFCQPPSAGQCAESSAISLQQCCSSCQTRSMTSLVVISVHYAAQCSCSVFYIGSDSRLLATASGSFTPFNMIRVNDSYQI